MRDTSITQLGDKPFLVSCGGGELPLANQAMGIYHGGACLHALSDVGKNCCSAFPLHIAKPIKFPLVTQVPILEQIWL